MLVFRERAAPAALREEREEGRGGSGGNRTLIELLKRQRLIH
jgi:hypothetical protein